MQVLDRCSRPSSPDIPPLSAHMQGDAGGWLRDHCLQTGDAFLIVFSVTDRRSFSKVPETLLRLRAGRPHHDLPVILVGNKSDLARSREVSLEGEFPVPHPSLKSPPSRSPLLHRALLPSRVHDQLPVAFSRLRADSQCPCLGPENPFSSRLTSSPRPLSLLPSAPPPPSARYLPCSRSLETRWPRPPSTASGHLLPLHPKPTLAPSRPRAARGRPNRSLPAEGRHLAGTLSCKHIETSAALHHNTRELFEGAVRQIRLRRGRGRAGGPRPEWGCPDGPPPPARRESLTKKAKRFLANLVPRNAKFFKQRSRSCHDLSVL